MSTRKPIKRNIHLVSLSKDHHFGLLFCWKIREGIRLNIEVERISRYAMHFWTNHLVDHFAEEECVLFASLVHPQLDKAIADHREISEAVKLLFPDKNSGYPQLARLADLLGDHIRFEERELFPLLESLLTDAELAKIGERLNQELVPENYPDQFWIRNKNGRS
jgi:hypothetical protein